MSKPKMRKQLRITDKAAQPYALGIGQTVLAWNDLQESLGRLFAKLMQSKWYLIKEGEDVTLTCDALEAWQSLKMDRAKRDMISAVLKIARAQEIAKWPKMVSDIAWLVSETNKLEDTRNEAIHSPLRFFHAIEDGKKSVEAATLSGNVRAKRLSKKDILAEIRYCRDTALILRGFADDLSPALYDESLLWPWPDRPKLPTRKPTKIKTQQRHQARRG